MPTTLHLLQTSAAYRTCRDRRGRRFKDVLAGWPDLLQRCYGFSDERHRGRARSWLAEEGYAPDPNRDRP